MKKIENFNKLPEKETCIALGCFDGIHKGHQAVLKNTVQVSKEKNLIPMVFTFKDNIKEFFLKKSVPKITLENHRCELFSQLKIKYVYSILSKDIIPLAPEEFISEILAKKLKAKHIFRGLNFYFGKNKAGNTETLKKICEPLNIKVHIIDPQYEGETLISSALIRTLILDGKVDLANNMLGRNFSYKLPVIKGSRIGHKLGFPTINQNFPNNFIIPKFGVYKSFVKIDNKIYKSITNIGVCPTTKSDSIPHSETFIFDCPYPNLYEKNISVNLCKFIREEKNFNSIDNLKNQILTDVNSCN